MAHLKRTNVQPVLSKWSRSCHEKASPSIGSSVPYSSSTCASLTHTFIHLSSCPINFGAAILGINQKVSSAQFIFDVNDLLSLFVDVINAALFRQFKKTTQEGDELTEKPARQEICEKMCSIWWQNTSKLRLQRGQLLIMDLQYLLFFNCEVLEVCR